MKKDTFLTWACILSALTVIGYILSGVIDCDNSYYNPPKASTSIIE